MITKNAAYEATIEGMTLDGNGVCRVEGMTVFVPLTAPGDRIRLKIVKLLSHYAFGRLEEVLTPSPDRIAADCPVFAQCGGCSFRHLRYEAECRLKQQAVQDAFSRIGGFSLAPEPILGAEETLHYRNKAQYPLGLTADGEPVAGFYARRSHRIIPSADCPLQDTAFSPVLAEILCWIREYRLPVYREETGKGLLRHVFLRRGRSSGDMMVCLVAAKPKLPHSEELVRRLTERFPAVKSIVLNHNPQRTNVILGKKTIVLYGSDRISDRLLDVSFSLSAPAFYQVNSEQTARLYQLAFQFAQLRGEELALDLYCGIGSIGLTAYPQLNRLIGVEIVPEAVENAKENAAQNGMTRTEFFCADAQGAAKELAARGLKPDVVFVDPPRKGCDPEVLTSIAAMAPGRVVMISCNPATAARDCRLLCEQGYRLERYRPVDLFPRTGHIETVVLLSRTEK